MFMRVILVKLVAGGLVLAAMNSAVGQVILETDLESADAADDRFGGYQPVLFDEGPQLAVQYEVPPAPVRVVDPAPYAVPMEYPPPAIYETPMPRSSCPPWRPCGPQESFGGNWLFKQGFAGADWRPSCAAHDACLASGCFSRKHCDRMYLANLDQACHGSRFPILCRIKAREYYLGVRLFGWLY